MTFDDFPLEGPRSSEWFFRELIKLAEGPRAQHLRWVRESKIPDGDRSIHEHYVIYRVTTYALEVDQVNVSSLVSFEALARRPQLIEEAQILFKNKSFYYRL